MRSISSSEHTHQECVTRMLIVQASTPHFSSLEHTYHRCMMHTLTEHGICTKVYSISSLNTYRLSKHAHLCVQHLQLRAKVGGEQVVPCCSPLAPLNEGWPCTHIIHEGNDTIDTNNANNTMIYDHQKLDVPCCSPLAPLKLKAGPAYDTTRHTCL